MPRWRCAFEHEQAKRAQGLATVPSTIGLEKATNPFLRDQMPTIVRHLIASGRLQGKYAGGSIRRAA